MHTWLKKYVGGVGGPDGKIFGWSRKRKPNIFPSGPTRIFSRPARQEYVCVRVCSILDGFYSCCPQVN